MGVVNGPGSSVVGNVVLWNDTTGTTVSDSAKTLSVGGLSDAITHYAAESMYVGQGAGVSITTDGGGNTAFGNKSLNAMTTGDSNTAIGDFALAASTTGQANCAFGSTALWVLVTGHRNIAIGESALQAITSGDGNIGIGENVGHTLTGGSGNIIIGDQRDVTGATVSNTLNIGDVITATGMDVPSTSTVTIPGALIVQGTISGFLTKFNNQTGTTYTLASTDTGKTVTLNNASAITVTLPNSLSTGFTCECIQLGAGQVTFSAASGATLNNRQSFTKIAGQNGAVRLVVTGNSGGTSAVYNLAGDCA
jgi:hypothetical protein